MMQNAILASRPAQIPRPHVWRTDARRVQQERRSPATSSLPRLPSPQLLPPHLCMTAAAGPPRGLRPARALHHPLRRGVRWWTTACHSGTPAGSGGPHGLNFLLVHAAGLAVVAGVVMFSGISGAAMLLPVFLIGFPLVGAPPLSTIEAVGWALFLETSGFRPGVCTGTCVGSRSTRRRQRDHSRGPPAGGPGRVVGPQAPEQLLRLGCGAAMLALGYLLLREPATADAPEHVLQTSAGGAAPAEQPPPDAQQEARVRTIALLQRAVRRDRHDVPARLHRVRRTRRVKRTSLTFTVSRIGDVARQLAEVSAG
jgi:hypothetical protein